MPSLRTCALPAIAAVVTACGADLGAPAPPGLSISVAGAAAETRARIITVAITAPGASEVRYGEGELGGNAFVALEPGLLDTLMAGDGEHVVLAQVRWPDGRVSDLVADTIVLSEHVYVATSGDDAHAGTFLNPKRHIAAAIAAAVAEGRTRVRLFPGRFSPGASGEVFPVAVPGGLTLEGVTPAPAAVLDAEGTATVIRVDSVDGVTLRDLRLTGGNGLRGGGLAIVGATVLAEGLQIVNNTAGAQGSAVFMSGGELTLRWSVIAANQSAPGADAHGVEIVDGHADIHNNTVAFGDSNGLIMRGQADGDIRNNIFFMNGRSAPTIRGRGICEVSIVHRTAIRYNLFFGNYSAAVLLGGTGDLTASAANTVSLTDAIYGNLDGDPLFVAGPSLDFRLLPGSPARDAGDPNPAFNDGDGTRNDIGYSGGR